MVYFVGAGPGAVDLITVRGQKLLREAEIVIYAGSLVNPELLQGLRTECQIYNSAKMTLEEVVYIINDAHLKGQTTVRLHTGDPSIYGAIREQIDLLEKNNIPYTVVPGVSSFCGAAAALHAEYTLPGISQSVILTRMEGRTPVPEMESIVNFAAHQSTMVIFLSAGMLELLETQLLSGGYTKDTPAAIVYKATWPEEQTYRCTVGTLAETGKSHKISQTALILVGEFLGSTYERSCLYNPSFSHGFRKSESVQGE